MSVAAVATRWIGWIGELIDSQLLKVELDNQRQNLISAIDRRLRSKQINLCFQTVKRNHGRRIQMIMSERVGIQRRRLHDQITEQPLPTRFPEPAAAFGPDGAG